MEQETKDAATEGEFVQFIQKVLYPDLIASCYFERFPVLDQIYPHLAEKSLTDLHTLFENYTTALQQGLILRSKIIARISELEATEKERGAHQKQIEQLDGFLKQTDAHNSRLAILGLQLYLKIRDSS